MNRPKSIFRRAAEGGVTLGAIFVCIFLLETVPNPLAGLFALGLMIYVPFAVYRKLKSTYFAAHGLMTYAGVWLEGILLFVFGSIILAFGSFLYMRWIVPGYLPALTGQVSAFIESQPQFLDNAISPELFKAYLASIRPIDISMTLMWLSAFTGSLASLVIAAIVKAKKVPPPNPNL